MIVLWLEEFRASHEESGKEESRFGSDIVEGVKGGIKEIYKRVETEKDEIEQDPSLVLVHDTNGDRVGADWWGAGSGGGVIS
jgi:hypothetical protein